MLEKQTITNQFHIIKTTKTNIQKHIITPLNKLYKKVTPYWYIPVIIILLFLLIKLIIWITKIKQKRKQEKNTKKETEKNSNKTDTNKKELETTYTHPKKVMAAIQKSPDTTVEIIENWIRKDNEK